MSLFNLPNIAVKGINTDIAPWDLPAEYISDGINFRTDKNSIISYGGKSLVAEAPESFSPGYGILLRGVLGNFAVMAGTTAIYAYQTGYDNISNNTSVPDGEEYNWVGCLNGSVLVLNNFAISPVYWNGRSEPVVDLPWNINNSDPYDDDGSGLATVTWKEQGYSAKSIRSHKNYLIAMNLDDQVLSSNSFRWSHPADENGIPFTWDPLNKSGTAGVQALGGDGGEIIDGLSLRDSFVIYSEKAIDVIDLSGDEFIWRRRELSKTVGLLAKNCVVEVKGIHYLMTRGDIVRCDGNNITSIAHDRIQKRLELLNTERLDRSFAFSNDKNKEIWFCIPELDSDNVTVAFIYQWKEDAWAIRELPVETGYIVAAPEIIATDDAWDDTDDTITWETGFEEWNYGASDVTFAIHPYSINHATSTLDLLDTSSSDDELNTFIERTDLPIDGQVQVTTITRLYPQMVGSSPVSIQVGSQDRANGAIRWKPAQEFDPSIQRKLDVRTTGALHCYRIESIGTGAFRLAGIDVEYQLDGIR